MEIFKEFTFEAAHRLPHVPNGHKCSRLHGHSYHVAVHIEGELDNRAGWVMRPILAQLDHYYLNEVEGLDNPTSEVVARWIWSRLQGSLLGLSQVIVRETCTSGCVYRGESAAGFVARSPQSYDDDDSDVLL